MTKKITSTLAASAFALAMQAQGNYTVNGNLSNAEGKKVYIITGDNSVDSTIVNNGRFSFTGKLDKPFEQARVAVGSLTDYNNQCVWQAALEPSVTVTITGDCNTPKEVKVNGGAIQEESNKIDEEMRPFLEPIKALSEKIREGADRDSVNALMEPYNKQYKEYTSNFYRQRTKSYFATRFLRFDTGRMTYDELKPIWDNLDPDVRQYGVFAQEIAQELDMMEKVRPGCPAPDFTANDINGKPFTLSSLRGKVVIIDFWASWCVPCRKSNPHMRGLYDKYHARGLDIVYVSDDDRNEGAWKKAVEKDMLTGEGYHHVLRGLKWDRSKGLSGIDHTNDISHKYAIHYLPTKYLIDRQGNIVCKINEGEDEQLNRQIERLLIE